MVSIWCTFWFGCVCVYVLFIFLMLFVYFFLCRLLRDCLLHDGNSVVIWKKVTNYKMAVIHASPPLFGKRQRMRSNSATFPNSQMYKFKIDMPVLFTENTPYFIQSSPQRNNRSPTKIYIEMRKVPNSHAFLSIFSLKLRGYNILVWYMLGKKQWSPKKMFRCCGIEEFLFFFCKIEIFLKSTP